MKTLQLQLRFLIPLLVALVIAALVVLPLMDQLTLRWFSRDLNARGALVAGTLSDAIDDAIASRSSARVQALFDRAARDERLVAIAMCSSNDELVRHSAAYPVSLTCAAAHAASQRPDQRLELPTGAVHVGLVPGQQRPHRRRHAGAAARPELRRSAQPGHPPLPDRSSSSDSAW